MSDRPDFANPPEPAAGAADPEPVAETPAVAAAVGPLPKRWLTDKQAIALLGGYLALRFVTVRLWIVMTPWLLANAPWALPLMRNTAVPIVLASAAVSGRPGLLIAVGSTSFFMSTVASLILYWAGGRFGLQLAERAAANPRSMWAGVWNPKQVERAHNWLERWGIPAVVVSRGTGWLIGAIALVGGASRMSRAKFIAANSLGAAIFAGATVWLGVRAGDAWPWIPDRIEGFANVAFRVGLVVLVLLVILMIVAQRGGQETAAPAGSESTGGEGGEGGEVR